MMQLIEKDYSAEFQTPPEVCNYMASLIPAGVKTVFEPTKGIGNIVRSLVDKYDITSPKNYFDSDRSKRYDCVVMNPPFSSKYAYGYPIEWENTGMRFGYKMLTECMLISDNVIALVPWFTISDSDTRLRKIKRYGLISVTALPRKTFQYVRIQTCILQLQKGFEGESKFIVYDCIADHQQTELFK